MAGIDPGNIIPKGTPMVTRQFSAGDATANLNLANVARSSVQTDVMIGILRGKNSKAQGLVRNASGQTARIMNDSVTFEYDDDSAGATMFVMKSEADILAAIRTSNDYAALAMSFVFRNSLMSSMTFNARSVVVDLNYKNPEVQAFMLKQLAAGVSLFLGEISQQEPAVIDGAFEVFAIMKSDQFSALSTMLMDPEDVPGEVPPITVIQGDSTKKVTTTQRVVGIQVNGEWIPVDEFTKRSIS